MPRATPPSAATWNTAATQPPYEIGARNQALELSGAQLHLNLHGYPAHEWTRPFTGYLPRGFELWTIPKGFFLSSAIIPPAETARTLIKP